MGDKYKRMSDDDILKLIKARIKHAVLFRAKFYRRDEVWLAVQNTAQLSEFTLEQIRLKWNYLYKKYKELLSPPTGVGTEDGADTAGTWKWFSYIHQYAKGQHTVNPPFVASSIPGCSITNICTDVVEVTVDPDMDATIIEEDVGTARDSISSVSADPAPSTSSSATTLSSSSATPSSSTSSSSQLTPRKNINKRDVFDFFKKESKRIKKEGKCILNFLGGYARKEDIPFRMPSSSDDDSD